MSTPGEFCDITLQEFSNAVHVSLKSMKRRFFRVTLERMLDKELSEYAELTLNISRHFKGPLVKIKVWPDRWLWIDMRRAAPGGGWLWSLTIEGRLSGNETWAQVIKRIKDLPDIIGLEVNEESLLNVKRLWTKILLKGPAGIVNRLGTLGR